jgi:hypothetical protein
VGSRKEPSIDSGLKPKAAFIVALSFAYSEQVDIILTGMHMLTSHSTRDSRSVRHSANLSRLRTLSFLLLLLYSYSVMASTTKPATLTPFGAALAGALGACFSNA